MDAKTDEVARLDYSKPPPGYEVATPDEDCEGWWPKDALAAAWVHFEAHNDPPGVIPCGPLGLFVTFGPGLPLFLSRAAAWAWHDRRHALVGPIELRESGEYRTTWPDPAWPRCLTWSDEQVAEVERWLVDSTAKMPEVLRG